jgi:putative two-component system response regulator
MADTVDSNGRNTVILAVDDAPENLDIVRNLLAPQYTVKAATNGPVALKIASKQPPDLILLDVQMPGMNGYEVCRQLKADPATAAIPVIFLTGESDVAANVDSAGGDGYAAKPIDPGVLLPMIEEHLAPADRP